LKTGAAAGTTGQLGGETEGEQAPNQELVSSTKSESSYLSSVPTSERMSENVASSVIERELVGRRGGQDDLRETVAAADFAFASEVVR
jgi:hypothetical protein